MSPASMFRPLSCNTCRGGGVIYAAVDRSWPCPQCNPEGWKAWVGRLGQENEPEAESLKREVSSLKWQMLDLENAEERLTRERDEARAEVEILRAALHSACGDSWVDADAACAVYIKHARAAATRTTGQTDA